MKKAFTLVELLVVIAIIAVLATILIPVIGRIGHERERVACVSNLRQLGMAANLFVGERGYYPGSVSDGAFSQTWHTLLEDFIPAAGRGREVIVNSPFLCPSARENSETFYVGRVPPAHSLGGFHASYSYNWMIENGDGTVVGKERLGLHPDAITRGLSKTVLLVDGGASYHLMPEHAAAGSRVRYWHQGRTNALFCDGHIGQFEEGDSISTYLNPR